MGKYVKTRMGVHICIISNKGDMQMSKLQGILQRLVSLTEAQENGDPTQRYFEVDGERKCSVTFFHKTETFEIEVYAQGEKPKKYQFDNIDMAAIEIFDLIN